MSRRSPLILVLAPLLFACQDYRFEQKCPETIKEQQVTRAAAKPRPADILFVVDNSGSMADEQENLAANFQAFIDEIAAPDSDYRIAVVSTDQINPTERAGQTTYLYEDEPGTGVPSYVGTNVSGCTVTDIAQGCFRGPNPDTRIIDAATMSPADQVALFPANVRVGSCGTGKETGLSAMIDALSKSRDGQCNEAFLREDANLVIILVSDEDDQSDDDVGDYIRELDALKSLENVRVAAIVGSADGEASNCAVGIGAECGSLCRGSGPVASSSRACNSMNASAVCEAYEACSNGQCQSIPRGIWDTEPGGCLLCTFFQADDCCSAFAGSRYVQFAQAIESQIAMNDSTFGVSGCNPGPDSQGRTACLIDSICQASFAETLERIAKDLVITSSYTLDPPALNPDGIGIRLRGGRWGDGVDLVPGEDFDVGLNGDGAATGVELKGDKVPAEDEEIDIFYVSEKIDSSDMPRGACM